MIRKRNRLRQIWYNVKGRCTKSSFACYKNYGGRGITICDEWLDFNVFKEWALRNGYSDNLTIERINNNLGYCPSNCTWVTNKQQQRNKSDNHFLTIDGVRKTLSQWCEEYNLCGNTVLKRLKKGMSEKEAIMTPIRKSFIDLTGRTFGRITVISPAYKNNRNQTYWNCTCSCGNTKIINGANLRSGVTLSCGCLHKEKVKLISTYRKKKNDNA